MRGALAGLALALIAATLVACGSDDGGSAQLSADEYRSQLNAACTTLFDGLEGLSAAAVDEDLDIDEIEQRSDEIAADFETTVGALEPPEELADAHETMVALGGQAPPDDAEREEFAEYQQENLDAFEALGADECAAGERKAIEQLQNAN